MGQDQNGAGSGKPLDLVARPDIGKFGGLDEAGGAVRKPKHDNAAAAQLLTGAVGLQIGAAAIRVAHFGVRYNPVCRLGGFSKTLFWVTLIR